MERLDFRLHDFTRCAWVDDRARALWAPRVERIVAAWAKLEVRSVVAGVRRCAIAVVDPGELPALRAELEPATLSVVELDRLAMGAHGYANVGTPAVTDRPYRQRVAVVAKHDVARVRAAWRDGAGDGIGDLLGYPACCTEFFEQVWVRERHLDTTWPMARNTTATVRGEDDRTIELGGPPQANILLRWLGVRAVPHLPCSADCAPSARLGERFVRLGRDEGFDEEMDWLEDMLRWPVQWSVLHGIAEILTPVVKIVTCSDATPRRYVVRREGERFPEAGARGLAFPYRVPRHLKVSHSAAFARGLGHAGDASRDRSER